MPNFRSPNRTLKKFGKSFYWAKQFLGYSMAKDASRLYRFCRYIDDLADGPDKTTDELVEVKKNIQSQIGKDHDITLDFLELKRKYQWSDDVTFALIDGIFQDTKKVAIKTTKELLRYAYRVAGSVGLMMCPILGCRDSRGLRHAIDLGIAMQITNICRDVLEDANQDRRYLPLPTISSNNIKTVVTHSISTVDIHVCKKIHSLLHLADRYYQSGFEGLCYLPPKSQRTILLAGLLYQRIGHKILKQGCHWKQGRVMVSWFEKVWITIYHLPMKYFRIKGLTRHDGLLHEHLKGLPFAAV